MRSLGPVATLGVAVLIGLLSPAGAPAQAAGEGEIVIPALSFSAQGGGEVDGHEPRNKLDEPDPGWVHFWYTPGHWLEWTVEEAEAGEYEVALKYAGKFDVQRSLAVNGRPAEGLAPFTIPRMGRWGTWGETTLPTKVMLSTGRNVLRITCEDEISVRLSDIVLKGPGNKPIELKASRFTGQGGGRVQVVTAPTRGYVTGLSARNEGYHWLEWTIEGAKAGCYGLQMHYSAEGNCRLKFELNGQPVKGLEDTIPPLTGDDRLWTVGTLPVPVVLKDGKNVLRVSMYKGERLGVPEFLYTEFGLSVLRLTPLAAGESLAGDVLEMTTKAELEELWKEKSAPRPFPVAPVGPPLPEVAGAIPTEAGHAFDAGGVKATIVKADVLPYVENDWSRRHEFENYDHPELQRFRRKYNLDAVVAPGKDEFERQLLLMKWVWEQWDFGSPDDLNRMREPFQVLEQARREHNFNCMFSSAVMRTAANAMGWVDRPMGGSNHSFDEIWSNQYRKWVSFDATSNWHPEKDGTPLSACELVEELLGGGDGYVRVSMTDEGLKREKDPKAGDRTSPSRTIKYYTNTDHLARRELYDKEHRFPITFELRDDGTVQPRWDAPPGPDVGPYFPINQAAMALVPKGNGVEVTLGTLTPNFKQFEVRIDGGQWKPSDTRFSWPLHQGQNRLEARSVNKFDVDGSVSTVVIEVK